MEDDPGGVQNVAQGRPQARPRALEQVGLRLLPVEQLPASLGQLRDSDELFLDQLLALVDR